MIPVGDLNEAGAVFETFHDRIYRYIVGFVHDPSEAEDLTQDTFLRAYRARESLRDPGATRGWLYRIATHVCLDRLRQRVPQVSVDDEQVRVPKPPICESPSPLEIAERAETSACVHRCLDYLSDSYRAVILLHEAHSLTASEIAQLLGVSLETAKVRLHRARKKLREIMELGCAISSSQSGVPCCEQKVHTGERTAIAVKPEILETYVGEYQLTPKFSIAVTREEGRLYLQATGQPRFEVFAEKETEFFLKIVDAQITFVKDDAGKITHLVLHQGEADQKAVKVK